MSKILKNNTGSDVLVSDIGLTVPASGQLTVEENYYPELARSSDVITLLSDAGPTLTYNDGTEDLAVSDAIDHIKGYLQKSPLTPSFGIPKVAVYPDEGESNSVPSHDWTDPTTWYQQSTRVTGESPSNVGLVYTLANQNVIDVVSGKITFENEIEDTYKVIVYDDAVEISGYTVDYDAGTITLDASPSGAITVDYSYENGSRFTVPIPSGFNHLKLKDAEIQFADDIVMKDITFEIWIDHPVHGWVSAFSKLYKNVKDLINIARRGTGEIKAIDVLSKPILVFPIHYDKRIVLENTSYDMELRVQTVNDEVMGGSWATITFYTESDA